jgi:hypothetical protein
MLLFVNSVVAMWHVWCVAVPSFWIHLADAELCCCCCKNDLGRLKYANSCSILFVCNAWVLSGGEGDGVRLRTCLLMGGLQTRMWQRDVQDASVLQPCSASAVDVLEFFLFRVGFAMHSVHDLHHCECYLRMAIMARRKACTDLWRKIWSARMKCTIANICYRSWVKSVLEIMGFAVAANSSLPWQASYKFHHWVYTYINQQSALFDQSSSGNILSQCNQ